MVVVMTLLFVSGVLLVMMSLLWCTSKGCSVEGRGRIIVVAVVLMVWW